MHKLHLAGAVVRSYPDGLTITRYPDGTVDARPEDDSTYRARAQALGYGDNTAAMSRDHEITHHLLAHWLGLPRSPTLAGVARKDFWPHWQVEEAAVLAVQRFARESDVDLLRIADGNCQRHGGSGK